MGRVTAGGGGGNGGVRDLPQVIEVGAEDARRPREGVRDTTREVAARVRHRLRAQQPDEHRADRRVGGEQTRGARRQRCERNLDTRSFRERNIDTRRFRSRELRSRELRSRELRSRELRSRELRPRELRSRELRSRKLRRRCERRACFHG